ncbi:MAG: hypothetical protein IJR85_07730 [Synergistaceae bacterium]|nr:hypothetical protein [Synergistaceae bacterium]
MKRSYLWLFVVLTFFEAVSAGGCGGSNSSNFAGTNGEADTNGEDYGGYLDDWEVYNTLYYLDGTTWKISSVSAYREDYETSSVQVPVTGYNFNFSTLKFMTTSDSFMLMDNTGTYYFEPITVTVNDCGPIPMIQAASGFKEVGTGYTYDYITKLDMYSQNIDALVSEETILIRGANFSRTRPFTKLSFSCTSYAKYLSMLHAPKYKVFVELVPAN